MFGHVTTMKGATINLGLSVHGTSHLLSFPRIRLFLMFIFLCIQYHHPEIATVNIFQIRLNFVSLPVEFECPPPDFPVNSQGTCILMVTSYAENRLMI